MTNDPMSPTPAPAPALATPVSKWSLLADIAQIALGALATAIPGAAAVVNLTDVAIRIGQKSAAVYQLHVGQPLDPSLIKPEAEIT